MSLTWRNIRQSDFYLKIPEPVCIGPTWKKNPDGGWALPEFTLGWQIIRWVHENPRVYMEASTAVHDPRVVAGLDRFVDLEKDFHGKDAMVATGIRSMCVTVLIDGPTDADPWGREALLLDGKKIGRLTSGGYSEVFGKSIGMGYVAPELATVGQKLKVRMQGELWDCEIVEDSPHDPTNARIRIDG